MRSLKAGYVHLYTFKTGVLSPVAHDLKLSLSQFRVRTDGYHINAEFDLASLVVEGAVVEGALVPDMLTIQQKREILENVSHKILEISKFPSAHFVGSVEGPVVDLDAANPGRVAVNGELSVHGQAHELKTHVSFSDKFFNDKARATGARSVGGQVTLTPSRWGIRPFSALLGAIKLKDEVSVRFEFSIEPGT